MDSPPNNPTKIKNFRLLSSYSTITLFLITILPIMSIFSFLTLGSSSLLNPISVSSQCRIISTSVDLRSSKVCELGFFNYNAKYVFYPSKNNKFRCRYDYYWTSVFEVEYKEYPSGHMQHALAEAPKEALPIHCRPSFVEAWSTKEKFKINETYNCQYTPGISLVDIDSDSLFDCRAEDPSPTEMVERYSILFTGLISSLLSEVGRSKLAVPSFLAGIFTGVFTAMVTAILFGILLTPKSGLVNTSEAMRPHHAVNWSHAKRVGLRVCLLAVYFSLLCWLTIQYGKMIGLTKIFRKY